jgi:hypothetical protein
MWHCPHCGVPQQETARCWVCRRSSTTCSTCRHFRPALAGDLGYCALDRHRQPLTGRELRGCWEERPGGMAAAPGPSALAKLEPHRLRSAAASQGMSPNLGADSGHARGFVPIELLAPIAPPAGGTRRSEGPDVIEARRQGPDLDPEAPLRPPFVLPEPDEDWTDRTSLFGEAER